MSSNKHMKNDYKAMANILHSLGITNYEKKVLPMMAECARSYAYTVLDEAHEVAQSSNKQIYDVTDLRKAIKTTKKKYFRKPLTKEEVLGISSGEREKLEQFPTPSGNEMHSTFQDFVTDVLSSFKTDRFPESLVKDDAATVPFDASHSRKTVKKPKKKIPTNKKKATASFESADINTPEPGCTSSIFQTESESYGSITEVPTKSSVDDIIESVVNGAYQFATKFDEEFAEVEGTKQELKLDTEESPAKQDVPDTFFKFTATTSPSASSSTARRIIKKSSATKRVTKVTSASNVEKNKSEPSATSSITKVSPAKEGVAVASLEFSAKISPPASSTTARRIAKKAVARKRVPTATSQLNVETDEPKPSATSSITKVSADQNQVETQPTPSSGSSLLYLLQLYEADKELQEKVEQSPEKDDVQIVSSKKTVSSPTIIRIKQNVVEEDDDYDASS